MIRSTQSGPPAGKDIGRAGLMLALIVGAALRLWNLTGPSQHTDEAFTFAMSALPVPALLHAVAARDFHPPLFYLATHYLMLWLARPEWDYRYITALFGCLTIAATWGAARRLFDGIAAAVAALAVALAPALIQYDRIYRMYAVIAALSTLAWWLLLEAEHACGRRRAWLFVAYALVAIVLPGVHYLGALMLACQGLYALTRRRLLAPAFIGLGLAALSYVPWLDDLRQQLPNGGMTLSRPGLDLGLVASLRGAFAAGMPDVFARVDVAVALTIVGVVVAGGWLGRRTALPFWLAALVLQVVVSIVLGKNLAYFPRYLLIDIPAVCIAFGLIVSSIAAARARMVAAVIAFAGLSLWALCASNVLFNPYYQFPDWYAVNLLMLRNEKPGDAVVLDAGYELLVVRDFTAFRDRRIHSFMNPGDLEPILGWIQRHPSTRVWYVQHQHFYWDAELRIATALAQHRREVVVHRWPRQSPVDDVTVVLFDKVPMTRGR